MGEIKAQSAANLFQSGRAYKRKGHLVLNKEGRKKTPQTQCP